MYKKSYSKEDNKICGGRYLKKRALHKSKKYGVLTVKYHMSIFFIIELMWLHFVSKLKNKIYNNILNFIKRTIGKVKILR